MLDDLGTNYRSVSGFEAAERFLGAINDLPSFCWLQLALEILLPQPTDSEGRRKSSRAA
jgi:hypothetical protein